MNNHNFSAIHQRISGSAMCTGQFRDFAVGSAFQPVFSLSHKTPVGYEALCRPRNAGGMQVSPLTLFGQVQEESENILLDRLCRAVHVQNFAGFSDQSWIFLNVNPLVTVLGKSYGSFFEEMLAHYKIPPCQVVVEILEKGIYDESILSAAVNYYKTMGCLIAIDDFGASHSNFDRIWNIQPDIVKFDRSIIVQAETSPVVRKALPNLVSLIQELGCIALMEGVETEQQALIAIDSNVDLVQGYYFGYPRSVLIDHAEPNNQLPELRDKHTVFAESIRMRYRDAVDQCLIEFKDVLQTMQSASASHEVACHSLLALPDVMRVYFLDENGNQIGVNMVKNQSAACMDPRYRPLADAVGANWSRRYYFRQAMLNPGETQISRPYRSLTGKTQCITISALVDTPGGKLVVCLDLDWS